jgi:tetratricopeptide (TPR) repeat protein
MFSKKTLWSIGLYHEYFDDFYFNGLSDLVIYINLSLQGDVMYLQDELSYFRRDNESGYMSNSNPAYNPSFGYCFADYFNILRLCDERGLVKNIDFSNLGFGYYNLVYVVSKTYPQVMESYELFCNYVKNKYNIVVGFRDIVEGHIDQDLFVFNEMSVLEAFYKADEFIKQNQPVKAEKFYRLWLHFNQNVTNRYIIYHLLGLLLASLHKLDEAKICFEQAIQIQPDFYKSQFSLAEIHIKQNNVDLAVPLLKQVVGSNPDDESDKAIIDAANRLLKEIRYESK